MSAERYADINNGRSYPPLTRLAAGKYAQAILRSSLGSPCECAPLFRKLDGTLAYPRRVDLMYSYRLLTQETDGRLGRACWASTKQTTGHDRGWGRLIHDVSHLLMRYRHPKFRPHDPPHDQIERDVQTLVELSGWLASPPAPSAQAVAEFRRQRSQERLESMRTRLAKWTAKRKRAETAIKKLTRQIKAAETRQVSP
jgi:hypothetical protein